MSYLATVARASLVVIMSFHVASYAFTFFIHKWIETHKPPHLLNSLNANWTAPTQITTANLNELFFFELTKPTLKET